MMNIENETIETTVNGIDFIIEYIYQDFEHIWNIKGYKNDFKYLLINKEVPCNGNLFEELVLSIEDIPF